jgi:glycosyltransferase involved in cell wall biosynthesis
MKLLILTQKIDINDDLLGFFHAWAAEFARQCDKLTIIALGVGEYSLPKNVEVLSLGKEKGGSKIKYLFNFYRYIWQERKNYDAVLVHMNAEYVLLGGPLWRALGKKVGLWYVHKQTGLKLKLTVALADVIFTTSPASFRLASSKIKIVGHGIDIPKFTHISRAQENGVFRIICVGRISEIKNQRLLIEAADILVNKKGVKNIKIDLVGGPVYERDIAYQHRIVQLAKEQGLADFVNFTGSVAYREIADIYARSDLSINLSPTGGMDKVVLESMAAGLPVIVFNKAFIFLRALSKNFVLEEAAAAELADKIVALINLNREERARLIALSREAVSRDHNLVKLVSRIVSELTR